MPNLATHAPSAARRPPLAASHGTARASLAVVVPNGEPPSEFRIFVSGWNESNGKGTFLFDEEAAALTMAAYQAWGVDLMIDLEHQWFCDGIPTDPTARDARGWCRLEVRADGSLWAVGVEWTPDGAERLRSKRQKYISPAFDFDTESLRVIEICNIALVSMPATRGTPALMSKRNKARDLRKLSAGPSFGDISTAVGAALNERFPRVEETDEYAWVVDLFDTTVVYQFKGDLFEVSYSYDGKTAVLGSDAVEVARTYAPVAAPAHVAAAPVVASQDPAPEAMSVEASAQLSAAFAALGGNKPMDPAIIAAALEALIKGDAKACMKILKDLVIATSSGGAAPAKDPDADTEDAPPPVGDGGADEDKEAPMAVASIAAASARLMRLTAAKDFVSAVEQVEAFRTSHVELAAEKAAIAKERAVLDAAKRVKLGKDLVSLANEHPSRVWADDKCEALKGPLAKMSIADLEEFVSDAIKAKPAAPALKPPVAKLAKATASDEALDEHGLTKAQLAICAEYGTDPATFAALRKRSNPTA